jgi:hypothetical protein
MFRANWWKLLRCLPEQHTAIIVELPIRTDQQTHIWLRRDNVGNNIDSTTYRTQLHSLRQWAAT